MIEVIKSKIADLNDRDEKINYLREFIQILILKILSDKKIFYKIAFLGGTALRIIYGLNRYSEDLDFSLYKKDGYDFKNMLQELKKELILYNLKVEMTYKEGIVDSSFVSFTDTLQKLHLNVSKDQRLSVKLEIDTNPPQGEGFEQKIINNYFIFPVICYDLPSLMAGKLHSVLFRKFVKGRDYYDLIWYLTREINPNIIVLNNAIKQTEKVSVGLTENNWKIYLLNRLEKIEFDKVKKDLANFLIRREELDIINLETIKNLLT